MLYARGVRNLYPKCSVPTSFLLSRNYLHIQPLSQCASRRVSDLNSSRSRQGGSRHFSSARCLRQDRHAEDLHDDATPYDAEKIVREAKQRFRDTLPKNYLTEEEYALYVRLYGPPLRETVPEDVGIHTHADMGGEQIRGPNERTIIKELEGGEFEEITYEIAAEELGEEDLDPEIETGLYSEAEVPQQDSELGDADLNRESLVSGKQWAMTEKLPNYVDAVSRNPREADALAQLAQDFERAQAERKEAEAKAAEEAALNGEALETEESLSWPEEYNDQVYEDWPSDPDFQRYHPYTVEGSFHGTSLELSLPKEDFVFPISDLLRRTHVDHVREAAERNYGGKGLPSSAETVSSAKNGNMGPVGLLATQKQMAEIEADAFMAGFMPAAYASCFAVLRETRKRLGNDWIQSKLKSGEGLSVLDLGSGGAALVAWEQILNAEWELLRENGEVSGAKPPGRKTVVVASDRLRGRLKTFLQDTTFLPRLPDYEHSGEMRGPRLDGGGQELPRKSYDIIIASHQLLKESETHRRQAVLNNVWHLLRKEGGVLAVIEKAHPRGFEAVAHARHTILNSFLLPQSGEPRVAAEDFNATYHREPEPGHVVAPCTTQGTCPMYVEPGKSTGRKDYCHFSQRFVRPQFHSSLLRKQADNHGDVEFSYVTVQRGLPKPSKLTGKEATEMAMEGYADSVTPPDMQTLPRLILPALKRKGHVTMDVCTPEGKIERWTVPKSFGKLPYHDARKSRWGDLWALGAKSRTERNVKLGKTKEMTKRSETSQRRALMRDLREAEGDVPKKKSAPKSKKQKRLDMLEEMRDIEEAEIDELVDEFEEDSQDDVRPTGRKGSSEP